MVPPNRVKESPFVLKNSLTGVCERQDSKAQQSVRDEVQRRNYRGMDPDLALAVVEVMRRGERYGLMWVALDLQSAGGRERLVRGLADEAGVLHLDKHILTVITAFEKDCLLGGISSIHPTNFLAATRQADLQPIMGDNTGLFQDKTPQGHFSYCRQCGDVKIFPDIASYLLATSDDALALHEAFKAILGANAIELNDLLSLDMLMGGASKVWGLDVQHRKTAKRARVAGDGTLEVLSRCARFIVVFCLLATSGMAIVLLFLDKTFGEAGRVAGAVMFSSIVLALLASVGQTGSWVRLLIRPYLPVGDGVGWLAPTMEEVVAVCFEDGIVPYKENYCWSGEDSTKGTLSCQGLKSKLVKPKYGSGSIIVAPNGKILGVVAGDLHRTLQSASNIVVHSSIGEVEFGAGTALSTVSLEQPTAGNTRPEDEQYLLVLAMTVSAVIIGGVLALSPASRIEVKWADANAMHTNKNNNRPQSPDYDETGPEAEVMYAKLKGVCSLGDRDQPRIGGYDLTILFYPKEKGKKTEVDEFPPLDKYQADRPLILISRQLDPTAKALLRLCAYKGTILAYNEDTGETSPFTTTAVEPKVARPEIPHRIWCLSACWAAFVMSLTLADECRQMVYPLIVMSRIFATSDSIREVLIFIHSFNEDVSVAASAGLHVPPLYDSAIQGIIPWLIIITGVFSAEAGSIPDVLVGSAPIALLCIYDLLGMVNAVRRKMLFWLYLYVVTIPIAVSASFVWIMFRNAIYIYLKWGLFVAVAVPFTASIISTAPLEAQIEKFFAGQLFIFVCIAASIYLASQYTLQTWPLNDANLRRPYSILNAEEEAIGKDNQWIVRLYRLFNPAESFARAVEIAPPGPTNVTATKIAWLFRTGISGLLLAGCFKLFQMIQDLERQKLAELSPEDPSRRSKRLRDQHCLHMKKSRMMTPILPVVDGRWAGLRLYPKRGTNMPVVAFDEKFSEKGAYLYG